MSAERGKGEGGRRALIASYLAVFSNPIVSEAMGVALKEELEIIAADENYQLLLDEVLRIATANHLYRDPLGGSVVMEVKNNPKYQTERRVVCVDHVVSKVVRSRLSVHQLLWSPSSEQFVGTEIEVDLGWVARSGKQVKRNTRGLEWIKENPDECRAMINFLKAAEPEE